MKTSIISITMSIILAATACQMKKDNTAIQMETAILEAKEFAETFINTVLAADTIALYDFLENDYIEQNTELITSEGMVIKGDKLMPWYCGFFGPAFKHFNIEGKFFDENFIASGNVVIHRYSYTMELTPKEGGDTITEVGHGIKIYQKSTEGTWKMLYDVWSNPQ